MKVDKFDLAILKVLQEDARASLQAISERVGLSSTPCWSRIKRMESEGVIQGYPVRVDPPSIGFSETVIVQVTLDIHAFGSADLGDCPDAGCRMDTKAGAAHDPVANPKVEQQFGDAGNEADDAGIGPRHGVRASDGVDQAGSCRIHFLTATIRERGANHAPPSCLAL